MSIQVLFAFLTGLLIFLLLSCKHSWHILDVCAYMLSLSHVQLFASPWTVAYQTHLFMEFSRPEYWNGQPFPSPGYLPNPGIKPRSPTLQADSLPAEPKRSPRILEWVAYPFSRRFSQPRNWTSVFYFAGRFFSNWAIREAHILETRPLLDIWPSNIFFPSISSFFLDMLSLSCLSNFQVEVLCQQ